MQSQGDTIEKTNAMTRNSKGCSKTTESRRALRGGVKEDPELAFERHAETK
jgi:hypothetical protein